MRSFNDLREADDQSLGRVRHLGVATDVRSSVEGVVAADTVPGVDPVVAVPPEELVRPAIAYHPVGASLPLEGVVARSSLDDVLASGPIHAVVPALGTDNVIPRGTVEGVRTRGAFDRASDPFTGRRRPPVGAVGLDPCASRQVAGS